MKQREAPTIAVSYDKVVFFKIKLIYIYIKREVHKTSSHLSGFIPLMVSLTVVSGTTAL